VFANICVPSVRFLNASETLATLNSLKGGDGLVREFTGLGTAIAECAAEMIFTYPDGIGDADRI